MLLSKEDCVGSTELDRECSAGERKIWFVPPSVGDNEPSVEGGGGEL